MYTLRALLLVAAITTLLTATKQLQAQDAAHLSTIAANLARTEGIDAASGIAYTRLYISDKPSPDATTLDLTQPTLTVQCTKRPNGKLSFELFINFGGVTDTSFYPPFKPTEDAPFPPATAKAIYTMEFLGYTKVKPMKRQWEHVVQPAGQLRYNNPGGGSTNLEEAAYFFQYLRSLPTLRITGEAHTASFLTDGLQAQLRKEPLCGASGL
jgi:hypothetical protein